MRKRQPTEQPLTQINNSGEGGRAAAKLAAQDDSFCRNLSHLNDAALDEALRCWAQRTSLSDADLGALRQLPLSFRTVDRDGFIVREGETPTSCSLILSGGCSSFGPSNLTPTRSLSSRTLQATPSTRS